MKDLPAEPTPEKKKRPPRKKKKKQTVPLETAQEEDEKEYTAADNGDKAQQSGTQALDEKPCEQEQSMEPAPLTAAQDTQQTVSDAPKLPQASSPAAKMPPAPSSSTKAASLNPNAKAWNVVSAKGPTPAPAVIANTTTAPRTPWATPTNNVNKQQPLPAAVPASAKPNMNAMKPVAVDTYKPKPGTWASMAVKKDTAPSSFANPTLNRPAQLAPQTPAQYGKPQIKQSTDWRNHVVSPHRSPYRNAGGQAGGPNINSLPPPPVSQPHQQAWPSLDEFGPALGTKKDVPKKTKPIGAWGTKPL